MAKAIGFVGVSIMGDIDAWSGSEDYDYDADDTSPTSSVEFDFVNPNPGSFDLKVYGTSNPISPEQRQRADQHAVGSLDRDVYVPDTMLSWGWICTSCNVKVDQQPRAYENGVEPVWWWWCPACREKGGSARSHTGLKRQDDTRRDPPKNKKKTTSAPTKTQKKKEDMAAKCEKIKFPRTTPSKS